MRTLALPLVILFSSLASAQAPSASPAAPSPAPVALPVDTIWSCKVDVPQGEEKPALTVGQRFNIVCDGPAIQLAKDKLALDLQKDQKWAIRFLETSVLTETHGEFVATSWMAGEMKILGPVLTDGVKRVSLGEIKFTVASVIDEKKNPEKKPYDAWSPVKLSWPLWLWGIVVGLIVLVGGASAYRLKSTFRRKGLLKRLAANPTTMTPYHQFNKDLRRLQRQLPLSGEWELPDSRSFFRELDEMIRWYLARVLVIQSLEGRGEDVARELKRGHPALYETLRRDLVIILTELEKARESMAIVSTADAQQLSELGRQLVDRVHKVKGE